MSNPISRMIAARERRSVIKLRLAKFRSSAGEAPIFVFEGPDDMMVYSRWICRIDPDKIYEPFVCNGKRESRAISWIIANDLGNLGSTFIFVDRDFDDLDGFASLSCIFMTDRYSIENYMVDLGLLDRICKDDLGCNGLPAVRARICGLFRGDLHAFLIATSAINFRMFLAKRCNLVRLLEPPNSISCMISLEIGNVELLPYSAPALLPLDYEPSVAAVTMLHAPFSSLDPMLRYRGKFLAKFFSKWLDKLRVALVNGDPRIVSPGETLGTIRGVDTGLMHLSARSPMPKGLAGFVTAAI